MKTSELTGPALDWAVAKCEGVLFPRSVPKYSTDWAQGGPIIGRELIALSPYLYTDDAWQATLATPNKHYCAYGPTTLIAAMRCFVAATLGDVIDIPTGLL